MARTALSFNVAGMAGLQAALDSLPRSMGRAALERAGLEAAEPTARLMRSLAPKDTGELAESIDVGTRATNGDQGTIAYEQAKRWGATDEQAVQYKRDTLRGLKGQRGDTYATVYIGPVAGRPREDVIKGMVQEFGTAKREPNAFMRPAWEQDKGPLLGRLRNGVAFEVFAAAEKARRLGRLRS